MTAKVFFASLLLIKIYTAGLFCMICLMNIRLKIKLSLTQKCKEVYNVNMLHEKVHDRVSFVY